MIIPVDVTLEQLRAYTKTQIISKLSTWLKNNFTKRQLILWLMEIDVMQLEPERIYQVDGQIASEISVTVDTETNLQVSKREVTWTYYATGEVNVITIKQYDANNVLLHTKAIKHYKDGRQPTVTEG
jgi:queuine/archaeosine tRNA-ribosyltransferase